MLMQIDCILCLLKMSLSAIRKATDEQNIIEELFKRVLKIDTLRGRRWDITPAEVAEMIFLAILKVVDNPDPFLEVKEEQNRKALSIYPWLKELVEQSPNPFSAAVKVSIVGNLVDSVIGDVPGDCVAGNRGADCTANIISLKDEVEKALLRDLPSKELSAFRQKIESSELVLYLCDNSGEIVFDRVLIEFIKKETKAEVVLVVRSTPALNDVTIKEASSVGMNRIAKVMENGISGPLPGTIISRCSSEMKEMYKKADLIISKGGGNYETMEAYSRGDKNTTFLVMCKCKPYCHHFGLEMHDLILKNVYLQ